MEGSGAEANGEDGMTHCPHCRKSLIEARPDRFGEFMPYLFPEWERQAMRRMGADMYKPWHVNEVGVERTCMRPERSLMREMGLVTWRYGGYLTLTEKGRAVAWAFKEWERVQRKAERKESRRSITSHRLRRRAAQPR